MNDDETNKLLREMHTAIVGDEKLGITGLVTRMGRAEKQVAENTNALFEVSPKVRQHDEWINNARLKIAKVAGGVTVVTALVVFVLDYLFKR